ncbi:unnamed protein product [Discosporangium mesarthrocarpum]
MMASWDGGGRERGDLRGITKEGEGRLTGEGAEVRARVRAGPGGGRPAMGMEGPSGGMGIAVAAGQTKGGTRRRRGGGGMPHGTLPGTTSPQGVDKVMTTEVLDPSDPLGRLPPRYELLVEACSWYLEVLPRVVYSKVEELDRMLLRAAAIRDEAQVEATRVGKLRKLRWRGGGYEPQKEKRLRQSYEFGLRAARNGYDLSWVSTEREAEIRRKKAARSPANREDSSNSMA